MDNQEGKTIRDLYEIDQEISYLNKKRDHLRKQKEELIEHFITNKYVEETYEYGTYCINIVEKKTKMINSAKMWELFPEEFREIAVIHVGTTKNVLGDEKSALVTEYKTTIKKEIKFIPNLGSKRNDPTPR